MNEMRTIISLRDLMTSAYGWGRDQGRTVFQDLIRQVEAHPGKLIIEVSLAGVERADISFASETVVELAKRFRGNKGFVLSNAVDEDLLENWDAAATRKEQPLSVLRDRGTALLGLRPSQGNATTLEFVLEKGSATAAEVANALDFQITNSSTKLKQLWEQGFLLRRQEVAESGGVEFRYLSIK